MKIEKERKRKNKKKKRASNAKLEAYILTTCVAASQRGCQDDSNTIVKGDTQFRIEPHEFDTFLNNIYIY